MHDVFISYSAKEIGKAEHVRRVLEKNGIMCWMAPADIPGGSNYTKEIPIAIRDCQVFVLMLSTNAQNSHWVLKELDSAVNNGKVILPFMLENCELNDEFNFLLSGAQRYSAYQRSAEALEKLVQRIKAIIEPRPVDVYITADDTHPEVVEQNRERVTSERESGNGLCCIACGSRDLAQLPKNKKSYNAAERSMCLVLPIAYVVGFFVILCVGAIICVSFDIPDSAGMITTMLLSLAGAVAAGFFCKQWINELIRRRRIRKHIRATGVECKTCRKKFRMEVSMDDLFPWEVHP